MLLDTFDYVRPNGLSDVLKVLDDLKHKRTLVMAGGTDLVPALRGGTAHADHVVDLSGAGLDGIALEAGQMRIGALVTFTRLRRDADVRTRLPALAEAAARIGAIQCQNLGTVGGNLCAAVPSLNSGPPLLAHEATLRLKSLAGERLVAVDKFFVGPRRTVLEPGEILTEILVPIEKGLDVSFLRLGRRKAMTLSIVNVAAGLALDRDGRVAKARIALGAVAPTPVRAPKAEQLLEGSPPTAGLLAEVGAMAATEISPISDMRASADYRRKIAAVLVQRALENSLGRLLGAAHAMSAEGAGA